MARPNPNEIDTEQISDEKWRQFTLLIAGGATRMRAERHLNLTAYKVHMQMVGDAKSKEMFDQAALTWLRAGIDMDAVNEICSNIMCGMKVEDAVEVQQLLGNDAVTVHKFRVWAARDPIVKEVYQEAQSIRVETMYDEIIEQADQTEADWYVDNKGNLRVNYDTAKRSEIKIRTRQWLMEKLGRARYGKVVKQEIDGFIQHDHAEVLDSARQRARKVQDERKQAETQMVH